MQLRIREIDREALKFHWRENGELQTHCFTRAPFGLTSSPFLLNGVLRAHLDHWNKTHPVEAVELQKSLFVDDIDGGMTVAETAAKRESAKQILSDATFDTHKWASNAPELDETIQDKDPELTAAKTQLGMTEGESKTLGVGWDKVRDNFIVHLGDPIEKVTKREVLSRLAKIYDLLGVAGPLTLTGKVIYRAACDTKQAWDAELPRKLQRKYRAWDNSLPNAVTVPRSLVSYREPVIAAALHSFGDASSDGVSAVVYSVVEQPSGVTQRLVAARTRLAKRGLTIPRLELVASHMAVNLLSNVYRYLESYLPST